MASRLECFEPDQSTGRPAAHAADVRIAASEHVIDELKRLLAEHPGESPVFLHLGESQVLRLPDSSASTPSNGLAGELRVLLGPDAIIG